MSLPEAVSIVVAVNGKFLSLPTINLTTLPLACSSAALGAKGRVWAGRSAGAGVYVQRALEDPPLHPLHHPSPAQNPPSPSGSQESRLRHDLKAVFTC